MTRREGVAARPFIKCLSFLNAAPPLFDLENQNLSELNSSEYLQEDFQSRKWPGGCGLHRAFLYGACHSWMVRIRLVFQNPTYSDLSRWKIIRISERGKCEQEVTRCKRVAVRWSIRDAVHERCFFTFLTNPTNIDLNCPDKRLLLGLSHVACRLIAHNYSILIPHSPISPTFDSDLCCESCDRPDLIAR